jgi:coenzyme F420 hydrogenase subunit beta
VADIACGDAWQRHENDGNPGRSLALVRTERGRALLNEARRLGYTTLATAGADDVLRAQTNLLDRRRALFGRLAAFRLLGVPTPSFKGFSLFRSWRAIGVRAQAKTVFGTLRRIVRRKWFRQRSELLRTAADGTLRLHVVAPLMRKGAQTHD